MKQGLWSHGGRLTAGISLLSLLLAGCDGKHDETLNGYVEADMVRVASPVGGQLLRLDTARGAEVKAGQALFVLEQASERAAVDEAAARWQQSRAQVDAPADGSAGKRQARPLAVIAAQLQAARTELRQAEADLARQRRLAAQGFYSGANLESQVSRRNSAAAKVEEIEAQQRAARSAVDVAAAQLAQSNWRLGQKTVAAPVAARVEDTLYRIGEWVPAGAPVVSLLEPGAVKARFFVPEPLLPRVKAGGKVLLSCDGCGAALPASISFVARSAEFTPPVIYSRENRSRLVYLVEAVPSAADAGKLRPGQPIDIRLEGGQ
jgi:HlyD family secretion protein